MSRVMVLVAIAAGCGGALVPQPELAAAKTSVYDADLDVVLDAIKEVAVSGFHVVEVSPKSHTVRTDWESVDPWPYPVHRMYFVRLDVAVTDRRPWQIAVVGHAGEIVDGMAALVSEIDSPPWLEHYTNDFITTVHERLEPYAVQVRTTAPAMPTFPARQPTPIEVSFDPSDRQIDRYRSPGLSPAFGVVEGSVGNISSHGGVAGVVITAYREHETLLTVSDDAGHYRFDHVTPGTYQISAYYSISGRGQIEARRSEIAVNPAEVVIVPLWIEVVK